MKSMLLIDVGNTHTHLGLVKRGKLGRTTNLKTAGWKSGESGRELLLWLDSFRPESAALCSVVPTATPLVKASLPESISSVFELTARTVVGIGIDYPKPASIGADRLANAVAARRAYGAPVVVVDFGTAVTFDVVNRAGDYVGGIIAPGLSAMTNYLHEKTALLPIVKIRDTAAIIGKSTSEAMLIGAVRGYRGLIKELLAGLRTELGARKLPVVLTGGYAGLIAKGLGVDCVVDPLLTLKGVWRAAEAQSPK